MKSNRVRILSACFSILFLLIAAPTSAQPAIPQTLNIPAVTRVCNQVNVASPDISAPVTEDIPALLERAGIPPENLLPSNGIHNPSLPLSEGDYWWHTFYGSAAADQGYGVAVDDSGGVYVTGYSNSSWDGPAGQVPLHAYSEFYDLTVLKLDASGAYQWHTFYGSISEDVGYGIALDGSGGVYIIDRSTRSWDGPEGQAPLHAFSESYEIAVLKLDASGAYQWHTFYGSTSSDNGDGIAVDGIGGVYITGSSDSSWNGPAGQAPLHAHTGYNDIVVLKLDSSGAYQWHTFYGSVDYDEGNGIAVDISDSIYIVGNSWSSWNGPAGQAPLHAHNGFYDIDVLKLDASGAYQWHTFYGSTNDDWGEGIAVDGSGGVYITGSGVSSWNGPAGQVPLHAHSGYGDIAVLKLDASGAYRWHTFYGSTDWDTSRGVAVDGGGRVYITGSSESSWNGPAGQAPLHAHSGYIDIVVLKLDASGAFQWHTFYGITNEDVGYGIAWDGSGWIYITGHSVSPWDGPAGQAPLHAHSGYDDINVLKLQSIPYRIYLPLTVR
jgi:hypothetical protein